MTAKLQTVQEEYKRLRTKAGDRDPENYLSSIHLLIIYVLSFLDLSIRDKYFLKPLFDSESFAFLLGVCLDAPSGLDYVISGF